MTKKKRLSASFFTDGSKPLYSKSGKMITVERANESFANRVNWENKSALCSSFFSSAI
jgi:hypothetical protein